MTLTSRIAILLIVLTFLLFIPFSLFAETYYVDGVSGNDASISGSSESPFATIQKAVDSTSSSGDEIRVAQGTYTGISAIDPDSSGETYYQVVFIRNKSLTLRGGYNTSDWTTSDPVTNITTIDAQQNGRGITIVGDGSQTVTVDGVSITGGNYSDLGNKYEAGLECSRTDSDCGGGLYAKFVTLILRKSVVSENNASDTNPSGGGGIYLSNCGSDSEIDNVTVSDNTASIYNSEGGGLELNYVSGITINNCDFTNNYSHNGGGITMFQPSGTVTIEDTCFSGNTCFSNGGAIYAKLTYTGETALYINRVNLDHNESSGGAGIYLQKQGNSAANVYLHNLILSNNTSSSTGDNNSLIYIDGGTVYNISMNHLTASDNSAASFLYARSYADSGETISTATVNNTIIDTFTNAFVGDEFSAGNVVINYNNTLINNVTNMEVTVSGTPTFNAGESIFNDPLLDSTYHLRPGSPAINAGMDAGVTTDIDGDARPKGSGYDIGADEFYAQPLSGIIMMLLN